jgi:hypothetical protein
LALAVQLLEIIPALGQTAPIPPAAIEQLQHAIGNRVEIGTILGGDYAAAGGIYSFRGGSIADLTLTKIGGGGDVAAPRPLGLGGIKWAPVLQGNLGAFAVNNDFESGYLAGNRAQYETHAVQFGGGARFYFGEHLSLAPLFSGLYGHTANEFHAGNPLGEAIKAAGSGTLVDWQVDTWSAVPAVELKYDWLWGRTAFEFRSRLNYFHTESFESSSPLVGVEGNSQTWENKLDVDVPLGWRCLKGELHTGGFFSRTELFGDAVQGLSLTGFYTLNGRFVWAPLGRLLKLRWVGLGASYFWGNNFQGWTAGVDLSLKL